jgi:CheY-like chemotaxis protein
MCLIITRFGAHVLVDPYSVNLPTSVEGVFLFKVLIAEDDLVSADMTEETLVGHGYEVCGIARTVSQAVALGLQHLPDLAVIDLRLANGGLGTDIVAQLGAVGRLGVLYATGDAAQVILTASDGHACLTKPFGAGELLRGLEIVADLVATGTAASPLPRGFQVLSPPLALPKKYTFGWQRFEGA